jgi:DNA-binding response OmpR family regulator
MSKERILVVDDEPNLAWAIERCLRDEGYEVITAANGIEALKVAERHRPDLIILDVVMPQMDGLQACSRLRRDPNLAATPILFLTGLGTIKCRIQGLDEGGDDYMIKPFDAEELGAHVRALLRRSRSVPGASSGSTEQGVRLVVGTLTLELNTCRVRVGETVEQLTPTEFDLLYHLMGNVGQIFSSEQLLQQVWGYPPGTADPSLVRWHIKNLRVKIERDPLHPTYIRTVTRHGYILDDPKPL